MKTKFYIITIAMFLTSIFCASTYALTNQWSYDLGTETPNLKYEIDQITADGKGGCSVVWIEKNYDTGTNTRAVAYFDKKGNKVWEKLYPKRYAKIAYCNKNMTVFAVTDDLGNQIVVTIDKKGQETVIEKPDAKIDGRVNSDIGPMGDKKGFFAEEENQTSDKVFLVRYSYK